MDLVWIALIAGVLGLAFAAFLVRFVLSQDQGSARMREISAAIKEGAMAFLGREYRVLAIVMVVIAIALGLVFSFLPDYGPVEGLLIGVALLFGAVSSALAGFIGMNVAVRANARTAAAAEKSLNQGLRVSFRAGAVMGICVVSIGIIGLTILYFALHTHFEAEKFLALIPAYGFGASGVAIFARVGGGIYTKAADTGADLVGKVEQGIPEDDPRNAAVIADFVGDNVGDVAGMGADLFESYVDSIIATMALSTLATALASLQNLWYMPLLIAAGGIIASLIGVFLVRVGEKPEMEALLAALRRGTLGASILVAIFSFLIVFFLDADMGVFWAVLSGLIAGVLIGESTNYFTSYSFSPTRRISEASQTGAGTNVVRGLANGLTSTVPPVLFIAIAIALAYHFAGFYGIAIAGVGMLSTLGVTLATDAYGPVADNSGGIVEMSALPHEIRERTDALDSLGNTTAATGKGFAIGSAALTALALMLSYSSSAGLGNTTGEIVAALSLLDYRVVAGMFLGAVMPAIFCGLTLTAVGKTTFSIIDEVRRQFREIPGLMEGTARPEYGKAVDICTRAAISRMLVPGLVTIIVPIIVGFVLGVEALAGFLLGAIMIGFILAIVLANAGGSWDNAKKWIEVGNYGGKGSDAHKAAVIGDTVGDPCKDTSGPSINIMIKLMSIVALVLAPVLAEVGGLLPPPV